MPLTAFSRTTGEELDVEQLLRRDAGLRPQVTQNFPRAPSPCRRRFGWRDPDWVVPRRSGSTSPGISASSTSACLRASSIAFREPV